MLSCFDFAIASQDLAAVSGNRGGARAETAAVKVADIWNLAERTTGEATVNAHQRPPQYPSRLSNVRIDAVPNSNGSSRAGTAPKRETAYETALATRCEPLTLLSGIDRSAAAVSDTFTSKAGFRWQFGRAGRTSMKTRIGLAFVLPIALSMMGDSRRRSDIFDPVTRNQRDVLLAE